MGQAFDESGNKLGEAFGETKAEVFEKLMKAHPDADSVEIHANRLDRQAPEAVDPAAPLAAVVRATNIAHQIVTAHNKSQKRRLKGQLHDLIDSL